MGSTTTRGLTGGPPNQGHHHTSSTSPPLDNNDNTDKNDNNDTKDRVITTIDATTGIATVELNRPEKLNALDLPMFYAISQAAHALRGDTSVRCVVLQGRGRAFCTGLDVAGCFGNITKKSPQAVMRELLDRPEPDQVDVQVPTNLAQDVAYAWRTLPVPVLCAAHGMVFGGGLQIALGADIRFVTPDCQLSIMETKWGLIPDMGASVTLRDVVVSQDIAKELTWTGRIITGTQAAQYGLVTHVVDDPIQAAHGLAQEICQRSPDAVAAAKELFRKTWVEPDELKCLQIETKLQKKLLLNWNQIAATTRTMSKTWHLPYTKRRNGNETSNPTK